MKLRLNKAELKSIGKGALIAGGGAVCTYLLGNVDAIASAILSDTEGILATTAVLSIVINYIRKAVTS